jgi:monoamine oxidase
VASERAITMAALPAAERRMLILKDLESYWAQRPPAPSNWWSRPRISRPGSAAWIGGTITSFPALGSWTSHARLAAGTEGGPAPASHGRVCWAGTEVSPRWPGYFEGAIEAGELAASTVARHLSP